MKIVQVASELFPYIKTGGLADVTGSLSATLAKRGHQVSVFLPGYRAVLDHHDASGAERILRLKIEMGDVFMSGEVRMFSPAPNLNIYLVCRDELFDRKGVYGNGERDYEDNYHRYIFFCKGVIESLRQLNLRADIVHAHDWQAAMLPLLLRYAERRTSTALALKTVFTIHNIAFQGIFPMRSFYRTNLPDEFRGLDGIEYYGQMNFLKGGILFADQVTTVSPRYAQEIQTPEFGCGLDGVIATRADDLVGLLNGIDTAVWNPAVDALLPSTFTAAKLGGKTVCRDELLQRMKLDPVPATGASGNVPVYGMVCRLTEQKGVQLLLANRDFFLNTDCRLVILGSGDKRLEQAMREFAAVAPRKIGLAMRLDETMSHLIEAGSDFFLMPSLFEPCGLNQMYSLAYGTVPLVSQVGGLYDTVKDVDQTDTAHEGTGITFAPNADAVRTGLERSHKLFADKSRYAAVQVRGMTVDNSWSKAAQSYERLYTEML